MVVYFGCTNWPFFEIQNIFLDRISDDFKHNRFRLPYKSGHNIKLLLVHDE